MPAREPKIRALGASEKDWNPKSFWYYPWGYSIVHKSIDIFASKGAHVIASTCGLVVYAGDIPVGGLGPARLF